MIQDQHYYRLKLHITNDVPVDEWNTSFDESNRVGMNRERATRYNALSLPWQRSAFSS